MDGHLQIGNMKAREENGQITTYSELPQDWGNILNFRMAPGSVQQSLGFYELVLPVYDPDLQVLGNIYFDSQNQVFTYPVINKTVEQLSAEKEEILEQIDNEFDIKAIKKLLIILTSHILEDPGVTQEQLEALTTIHPQYRIGKPYVAGDIFVYEKELFKVNEEKDHTSQADWVPSSTPSLYSRYTPPGVIVEWVQPLGSHDAYQVGAKVTHNGKTWESTADNNVWEPGVYGWIEI